jgi:hypothetical protein
MGSLIEKFGVSVIVSLIVGAVIFFSPDEASPWRYQGISNAILIFAPVLATVVNYLIGRAHRSAESFDSRSPSDRGDAVLKEAVKKFSNYAQK